MLLGYGCGPWALYPTLAEVCSPSGWCQTRLPELRGIIMNGLWGVSAQQVWAVGERGTVVMFDGEGWRVVSSPTRANLLAVHGAASGEAVVVRAAGTAIVWNGRNGRSIDTGFVNRDLITVWMHTPNRVFTAGRAASGGDRDAILLRFDGSPGTQNGNSKTAILVPFGLFV
ncbi:hypothetical protein C2W62_44465, partial [Candidatus Entotheonella serta]